MTCQPAGYDPAAVVFAVLWRLVTADHTPPSLSLSLTHIYHTSGFLLDKGEREVRDYRGSADYQQACFSRLRCEINKGSAELLDLLDPPSVTPVEGPQYL